MDEVSTDPSPLTDTRKDIDGWVRRLATPAERAAAESVLARDAVGCLSVFAGRMDAALGAVGLVVAEPQADLARDFETALFFRQPPPADALAFYRREAAAVREWLVARLTRLVPETRDDRRRRQLGGWKDYHQVAGALPDQVRVVHELLDYCLLAEGEAAALLALPAAEFEEGRDYVERRLAPHLAVANGD